MNVLQPYEDIPEDTNYIASTPDHVLWGRLPSRNDSYIGSVNSTTGDIIVDTVSHEGLLPDQGSDPVTYFRMHGLSRKQILDDAVAIVHQVSHDAQADGPHIVTGPIHVPHAHPGDMLAITIQKLEPRVPYGVVSTRHGRGVLAYSDDFDGNYGQFCRVEDGVVKFPINDVHSDSESTDKVFVEFPMKPFLGIIGVVPDCDERPNSIPPANYGGNIDLKELTEGATLFLPVQVEGAGLYIGDSHFAQGNGEVCLTALEASLRAHLHVEVVSKQQRTQLCSSLDTPFAYLPAAISGTSYGTLIPLGMGHDIDEALRHCVRNAIVLIANLFGLSERQTYLLLSAAVDFEVTQAVDIVRGAHALIDISIFVQCPRFAAAFELLQQYVLPPSNSVSRVSASLHAAVDRYETALMSNDIETMSKLFADDPDGLAVTRVDSSGLLTGHDMITAFRAGRREIPKRTLIRRSIRQISTDAASVVSEFEKTTGGNIIQSQVWQRLHGNWQIVDAHLTYPVPAVDQRIWRIAGAPLVKASHANYVDSALLAGMSVAVKDLFAVRGFAIGAGNPTYLSTAPIQHQHAVAVQQLLDAGASVAGIAQTDEFAYSLAGANVHYGTPPNPKAPGRISGGSSSGPAAAVASGQADIGLGTDTAGSIRIPAAYQGLWGLRTTHNRVSREGVYPLSETFDTVGCLTRDGHTLALSAQALMPEKDWYQIGDYRTGGANLAICPALDMCAQSDVRDACANWLSTVVKQSGDTGNTTAPALLTVSELPYTTTLVDQWLSLFNTVRGYEAWRINGEWVSKHPSAIAPEIAARFACDSHITVDDYKQAYEQLLHARSWIRKTLGSQVLIIPAASSIAPVAHPDAQGLAAIEEARAQTLRLTSVAGVAGLPAVTIPYQTADGMPCGICLIGPAGSDKSLIALAIQLQQSMLH